MKEEYENLTVEEAYQTGVAKKIGIPSLAGTNPLANGKTGIGINYEQPSNNGAFVSLADLYSNMSDEERLMTVAQFLKTKNPSNKILWILGFVGLIFIAIAAFMLFGR